MFSANNQMVSIVMYIWLLLGGSSRLYRVSFLLDDLIAKEGEDFYMVAAGEAVRGLLSVPLQAICLLNGALRLKNEVIQRNKDAVVLEGCYLTQYIAVLITLLICSWNNWREKASCHRCPQQGICHRVSPPMCMLVYLPCWLPILLYISVGNAPLFGLVLFNSLLSLLWALCFNFTEGTETWSIWFSSKKHLQPLFLALHSSLLLFAYNFKYDMW